MQNNQMQVFENQAFGKVRVVEKDSQPWWVLKDVCKALGIENPSYVRNRLDDDEVGSFDLPHPQNRNKWLKMTCVSESGLYAIILRSDKPNARAFRRWVTADILPSIRKHKAYIAPDTLARTWEGRDVADQIIQALTESQAISLTLAGFVETMRPKADYYDAILQNPHALPVTLIAKDYGMSAIQFNRLLHKLGIQYKCRRTWVLYAPYTDLGYTLSKTYLVDGVQVAIHTCWTQAGRLFIFNRLQEHGILPTACTLVDPPAQIVMEGV